MSNQQKTPKITWGASYANTLTIAYVLDNWRAYSIAREGSEWVQAMSGVEDAWVIGEDYYLEADVRWIPSSNTISPVASGWNGIAGWSALLTWARQKNPIRWYSDKDSGSYITSYLVDTETIHGIEPDGTRNFRMKIRNSTEGYTY